MTHKRLQQHAEQDLSTAIMPQNTVDICQFVGLVLSAATLSSSLTSSTMAVFLTDTTLPKEWSIYSARLARNIAQCGAQRFVFATENKRQSVRQHSIRIGCCSQHQTHSSRERLKPDARQACTVRTSLLCFDAVCSCDDPQNRA